MKSLYTGGLLLALCCCLRVAGQNVGINTLSPVNQLQIGSTPGYSGNHLAFGNGSQATGLAQTGTLAQWYSTTNIGFLPVNGTGYLGINTTTPNNHLEIGNAGGFIGNDIAFGNGTNASALAQGNSVGYWLSTTNIGLMPNQGTGNLGINTETPTNRLQVGSIPDYTGFDIAFGNGAQESGLAQTASISEWYSNTYISLMPGGNGHGRVGINTATPVAPLDVEDDVLFSGSFRYAWFNAGGGINTSDNYTPGLISIVAAEGIRASEFDAISDARIKDIKGVSNPANDLQTLNKIEVTDYQMRDKVRFGNKPFKKVIAQQVETVYPQVVSRHTDFVPNVYKAASKISRTEKGLLVEFADDHHIDKQATRLKVLMPGSSTMTTVDILSIPSSGQVEIKWSGATPEKMFVYGEEVNDFRAVDYEGLSTLNISATQQLTRMVEAQQKEIDELKKEMELLKSKKLD